MLDKTTNEIISKQDVVNERKSFPPSPIEFKLPENRPILFASHFRSFAIYSMKSLPHNPEGNIYIWKFKRFEVLRSSIIT